MSENKGTISAVLCFFIWGLFPLYWSMLKEVSSMEILANRMIWSALFLFIFCLWRSRDSFFEIIKNTKNVIFMAVSGCIISINWGTYIYAVNHNYVIESSLGYYINPLVNILLGVVFFKEKLNPLEKIATLLAFIGVLYFSINYGRIPWFAIILAITFSFYGMVKKKAKLPSTEALTLETLLISPIAIIYLIYSISTGNFIISELSGFAIFLLIMSGVVTALPLLFFAEAIKALPLSTIGFIQYIGPTLQLLCGVFVFNEPFTTSHIVCFVFIWLGLVIFTYNMLRKSVLSRKTLKS